MVELILKKSAKTYVNKEGKEKNYYDLCLRFENGKVVAIKPKFENDYTTLKVFAKYEK